MSHDPQKNPLGLPLDVQCSKHYISFLIISYFCLKEWKLKTLTRLLLIHIKNLKQALNHGLVLKKVNKVINFNQEAWLKSCNDMNNELRKKS